MKNTFKILGLLAGVFVFLCACKEDELTTYTQENNIYFTNRLTDNYNTRITVTWGDDDKQYKSPVISGGTAYRPQDTLKHAMAKYGSIALIPVRLMGATANVKRTFAYEATAIYREQKEGEEGYDATALARTKFEILDAFIPANSRDGGILVRLIDDEMEESDVFTIKFELKANENFQINYPKAPLGDGTDTMVSTTEITLEYNQMIPEPTYWRNSNTTGYFYLAFGPFSFAKYMIMVTQFEIDTSDQWLYADKVATRPAWPAVLAYGYMLRDYLKAQAALGNIIMCPVTGEPMTAGVLCS